MSKGGGGGGGGHLLRNLAIGLVLFLVIYTLLTHNGLALGWLHHVGDHVNSFLASIGHHKGGHHHGHGHKSN